MIDPKVAAELSKLKLSEDELRKLREDLEDIYSLIKSLSDLDIDEEPMYTPSDSRNVGRSDEPEKGLGKEWIDIVPFVRETEDGKYVFSPRP